MQRRLYRAVWDGEPDRVHRHSWSQQPPKPFEPGIERWVRDEISPLLDAVGGSPLLIAKSLGTNAATLAAERCLPAVWLTPILTFPWVAAALGRATAPFLVVGGTADALWDGALARRLRRGCGVGSWLGQRDQAPRAVVGDAQPDTAAAVRALHVRWLRR